MLEIVSMMHLRVTSSLPFCCIYCALVDVIVLQFLSSIPVVSIVITVFIIIEPLLVLGWYVETDFKAI